MKICPDCAENVKDAARVCRYCGYRFDKTRVRDRPPGPKQRDAAQPRTPPTPEDIQQKKAAHDRRVARLREFMNAQGIPVKKRWLKRATEVLPLSSAWDDDAELHLAATGSSSCVLATDKGIIFRTGSTFMMLWHKLIPYSDITGARRGKILRRTIIIDRRGKLTLDFEIDQRNRVETFVNFINERAG